MAADTSSAPSTPTRGPPLRSRPPPARARGLVTDYRLAPHPPSPAAVDDAATAWRWLLQQGFATSRLAIAGDSAGGGLTLATLVNLRDQKLGLPACALAISPWVDLEGGGHSITARAG